MVVDARHLAIDPVASTTTSTTTTTTSTTTNPLCVDGRACDDGDPCTSDDHCQDRVCAGQVTDVAGVECTLAGLAAEPCGAEALPRKLDKRIRKKVHKTLSLLETAVKVAGKGRQEKAETLRGRAAAQLDAISQQAAKATQARNAAKRISTTCRDAIDGIVNGGHLVVEGLRF